MHDSNESEDLVKSGVARPSPSAAFVICVETGLLEYKALCLVLTLRRNAGRWKELPIIAYSPRKGRQVSPWLKQVFTESNVTLVEDELNKDYFNYPLANKPLAMANAENRARQDLVIFLDTDVLVWGEPDELELPPSKCLGMVIDADKSVGSAGPGDEFDGMWLRLYALAGVQTPHFVQTTLGKETVRGWWCSGVISSRRSAGLMNEWLGLFERAMQSDIFVPRAQYLREQMTFSAMATRNMEHVCNFSPRYNYHVQSCDKYLQLYELPPRSAIFWHYQCYFDKAFVRFKTSLDRVDDVSRKIDLAWRFIERLRNNHEKMIGIDEHWLSSWRRKLRIGIRLRNMLGRPRDTDRFA